MGHGTILTGGEGQGDVTVYVDDNGNSRFYSDGEQTAVNDAGKAVVKGDTVNFTWVDASGRDPAYLSVSSIGTGATGDVNDAGTKINISDGGTTSLSGNVSIDVSGKYGSNTGFGGEKGVTCSNVDSKAAYLS